MIFTRSYLHACVFINLICIYFDKKYGVIINISFIIYTIQLHYFILCVLWKNYFQDDIYDKIHDKEDDNS